MFTIPHRPTFARWVLIGCLTLLAAASATPVAARSDSIVVFGTSLSDPGNEFALNGGTNTPPHYSNDALLVPDAPYARGGHHLSNGATWIEQYAASFGLAPSVQPAFLAANPGATNFAVNAARARDDGKNVNLSNQVAAFFARAEGIADSDALYVVEIGANDVRDAFQAAVTQGNPAAVVQDALQSIALNITALHTAGARKFVVCNVPNIALTPALRMLGPVAGSLATQLTMAFNAGLDGVVGELAMLPGIELRRLNVFDKLNAINADPAAFGLTNVTTACITPDVAPYVCADPDEFLFWDGIHPTRAGHALLAQELAFVLSQ